MDLFQNRREYRMSGLRRQELNPDPIVQFETWLNEALEFNIIDPTAMVLATVGADNQPQQRIVLLKKINRQGFVFFTCKESNKALDMQHNPAVSLHFPWNSLERQVKVNGVVKLLTTNENKEYFQQRPRASQLATWVAQQSQPLASRQILLDNYERKQREFSGAVPMPDNWGGYCVVPHLFEFWQGGEHRLHDRFVYQRENNSHWKIQRLAP